MSIITKNTLGAFAAGAVFTGVAVVGLNAISHQRIHNGIVHNGIVESGDHAHSESGQSNQSDGIVIEPQSDNAEDRVVVKHGVIASQAEKLASAEHDHHHDQMNESVEPDDATNLNSDSMHQLMSLVASVRDSENPYNVGGVSEEFARLLSESPELISEVMEQFGQLEFGLDKEILLSMLIDSSMMLGNNEIEIQAMKMIGSGNYDHDDGLYVLSKEIGVRTAQSRELLLNKLPSLSAPEQVHAVIESFVPQIVAAEEKQKLIAELTPYLNDPDDRVRGSTIKALGTWGGQEQVPTIVGGLQDHSGDIRHASAVTALRSSVRSDEIKFNLLDIMNNPSEETDIRQQAYYALSNYTLDGQDYEDYYSFNLELAEVTGHAH